ncbi:MAG: helical backbone metal receptor [Gammaproteobacteria bacterium]
MLTDAIGQDHARAGNDARIVSLVPSVTELLFALDLGAQVVGRTGFCIHPREAVRRVRKLGGTKDVDLEGIRGLAPSHVIVNIDENERPTFEALCEFVPHVVVTHPNAPEDNLALYALIGGIFGREPAAAMLSGRLRTRLDKLRARRAGRPSRRVVYLIWREPWMTVSRDTYIARMLELVNWHTLPATSERRYPELTAADFRAFSPDLCLLSSEPYPFREKHLDEVRGLCGEGTDVQLIDGEMLSWYGSRAIDGLDYLARLADARTGQLA